MLWSDSAKRPKEQSARVGLVSRQVDLGRRVLSLAIPSQPPSHKKVVNFLLSFIRLLLSTTPSSSGSLRGMLVQFPVMMSTHKGWFWASRVSRLIYCCPQPMSNIPSCSGPKVVGSAKSFNTNGKDSSRSVKYVLVQRIVGSFPSLSRYAQQSKMIRGEQPLLLETC